MPYFQMICGGNATRTYKAHSAADVVAYHEKHGMNTYEVKRVEKDVYDRAREIDGCVMHGAMDLTGAT